MLPNIVLLSCGGHEKFDKIHELPGAIILQASLEIWDDLICLQILHMLALKL